MGGVMIDLDEVKLRMGIPLTDPSEDQSIQGCIDAAYSFLARVHPLIDWTAADASRRQGMIWLISRYHQELGRSDSSVDSIDGMMPLVGRQANEMLSIGYHYPPAVA